MSVKPEAQILDATAGNRTIYTTKNDSRILYIDIEPDLTIKPDLILDCTATGFPNASFHTIIFDPPHEYGRQKNIGQNTTPNRINIKPEWNAKCWNPNKIPGYYGSDKYKNAHELGVFIRKAAQEFSRILTHDGIILIKWGETTKSADRILTWFRIVGFTELMRTQRHKPGPTSHNCVWVMLMKKREPEP